MSRKTSSLIFLFALLLIPSALLAQSNTGARTGPRVRPKSGHVLVAPYWTVEAGWSTELEVRNNLGQDDLVVTPALRTFDGLEIQLGPITIPADQVRSVNLADAIQAANPKLSGGANYSFGSLTLRYNSISTQNVYAAVVVHHEGYPINFHFDAFLVDSSFASGSSETIWWLPNPTSDGYLVVSNFSSRLVTAEQVVTGSKSSRGQQSFSVGAHETRRFSIRELKHTLGIEGNVGGIKVAFDSDAGSVYVSNVLFDEFSGFSAIMKVFNRDASAQLERITLMAPLIGLRVPDAMLGYPAGTVLQPQLFVRNASSHALASSILVNWKSSTSTGKVSLNIPPLAPEETRLVDLGAMQQNGTLPPNANWASVGITYDGRPGDLVPVAASYDSSSRYGVQSPFSSDLSFMWKGGMWHVDGTHNTLITTGNAGQKPAQVVVTLFYGQNAVYELPVKQLAPGEQTWVDIGELIRNGIPDKNRRIMPADTMSGSYEIKDLNDSSIGYLYEGKIISDKKFGHATYGCAACCGFDDAYLAPDPLFGPIGGNGSFGVWATNSCTGVPTNKSGLAYNWASSVPPVATVDASGNTTWISIGTTSVTSSINLRSPIGINNCHVATFPLDAPGIVIPNFTVGYNAYIAVDNVQGPTVCFYQQLPWTKVYMGDGNRGTYRTAEQIQVIPDLQTSLNFFQNTGQTRNYGYYSPLNGSTLSSLDEDGVANDCLLWNLAGQATPNFSHDESYPQAHQAQVHYTGSVSNPLEIVTAPITWDMRTVLDTTNPQSPTAYVNYNHTCYPAHQVIVNGTVVYAYFPPDNSAFYILGCLFFQTGKVIGVSQVKSVPTH
jgi:hypothetical protein